jgi:hypothetical protein
MSVKHIIPVLLPSTMQNESEDTGKIRGGLYPSE